MKSISIYAITREQNTEALQKLEWHLSGRVGPMKIRSWEMDSLKALVRNLQLAMDNVAALRLFYSFQIPRLGKEFDLLQIKEDQIVNIELKSGAVSDEALRKQLLQNQYYLSILGKTVKSYTYISSEDRLVRLTKTGNLADAAWEQLAGNLQEESADFRGDAEELFRAELYLISPITEPERFLNREYFLTAQQRDIERQILGKMKAASGGRFYFTGLSGTGKSLLLYDLAMKLSYRQSVCMIHCGENGDRWKTLHKRLRRINYLSDRELTGGDPGTGDSPLCLTSYSAILVDEAHLLTPEKLTILLEAAGDLPIIFSGDQEDMIAPEELHNSATQSLLQIPGLQIFRLTNRIRTNAELSTFIRNMVKLRPGGNRRAYPHITVLFANDEDEACNFLQDAVRLGYSETDETWQDAEKLVVVLDEQYYYDELGYLRSKNLAVRSLVRRLNLAKEDLMLIVKGNELLYTELMRIL